jgi:PAS domain S-box-containing protein
MGIRSRVLLSIAASLAISVLILFLIFSTIRGMEKEAARNREYEEIQGKTDALNLLASRIEPQAYPSRIRQIQEVRRSLENLLGSMDSLEPREERHVRRIRSNSRELEYSLERLISLSRAPRNDMEAERYNVLLSQLWMKTQFIHDDTRHLMEISDSRFASAQRNAVFLTIFGIIALMLANTAISFYSGRKIIRIQDSLRQALAKAEEGDRLLSAFMEHVPEGVGMVDAELNPTRVSRDGKERMLGFPFSGGAMGENGAQQELFHADGNTSMAFEELPLVRAVRHGDVVKDVEVVRVDPQGERMPLLCSAGPIREADGRIVGGILVSRDITKRKESEEAVRKSEERLKILLGEKEVLLKEVHHRVKNNLQVITSLVSLQSDELDDLSLRAVFQDVNNRVRSIAMVHEKLYNSADLAQIEFSEYAQGLLDYLWRAHGIGGTGIRLVTDMEPVGISVAKAVPCGLILNELVSNALKHAFRDRTDGEVAVSLRGGEQDTVTLSVRDNGTGLPSGFDLSRCRSLGLRLVQMLARQLHGTVEIERGAGTGTGFVITFGGSRT